MTDLDQLRTSVKREALAQALAHGEPLVEAAKLAGIATFGEAQELAHQPETIALVEADNPEVAAELRADAEVGDDPLAILERGAKAAALSIVQKVESGEAPTATAKQLIDLALKLRNAQSERPPELKISLPKTHVQPLLDACREFNGLLASLLAEPSSADGPDAKSGSPDDGQLAPAE